MIDYFCKLLSTSWSGETAGMGTAGWAWGRRCPLHGVGCIECITVAGSDLESGLLILSLNQYYYCYGMLEVLIDIYMLRSQIVSSNLLHHTPTAYLSRMVWTT